MICSFFFVSYCFIVFFLPWVGYVFGLIECSHSLPALHSGLQLLIIIIIINIISFFAPAQKCYRSDPIRNFFVMPSNIPVRASRCFRQYPNECHVNYSIVTVQAFVMCLSDLFTWTCSSWNKLEQALLFMKFTSQSDAVNQALCINKYPKEIQDCNVTKKCTSKIKI